MDIRLAAPEDIEILALLDHHIARAELEGCIDRGRISYLGGIPIKMPG